MTDITIPPEAVEAAWLAYQKEKSAGHGDPSPFGLQAALRAGIAAWPGVFYHPERPDEEACVFLPLPQENK